MNIFAYNKSEFQTILLKLTYIDGIIEWNNALHLYLSSIKNFYIDINKNFDSDDQNRMKLYESLINGYIDMYKINKFHLFEIEQEILKRLTNDENYNKIIDLINKRNEIYTIPSEILLNDLKSFECWDINIYNKLLDRMKSLENPILKKCL